MFAIFLRISRRDGISFSIRWQKKWHEVTLWRSDIWSEVFGHSRQKDCKHDSTANRNYWIKNGSWLHQISQPEAFFRGCGRDLIGANKLFWRKIVWRLQSWTTFTGKPTPIFVRINLRIFHNFADVTYAQHFSKVLAFHELVTLSKLSCQSQDIPWNAYSYGASWEFVGIIKLNWLTEIPLCGVSDAKKLESNNILVLLRCRKTLASNQKLISWELGRDRRAFRMSLIWLRMTELCTRKIRNASRSAASVKDLAVTLHHLSRNLFHLAESGKAGWESGREKNHSNWLLAIHFLPDSHNFNSRWSSIILNLKITNYLRTLFSLLYSFLRLSWRGDA
jgi:hypothetical protein